MLKQIAKFQEELNRGVFEDVPSLRTPFITESTGVIFGKDGVFTNDGLIRVFQRATTQGKEPIIGLHTNWTGGNHVLFYGNLTQLWKYVGETLTNLGSGFSGVDLVEPATSWSFASINDYTVATNGINAPQRSTSAGAFTAFPSGAGQRNFDTAEIVLSAFNRFLFFNLTGVNKYNNQVVWSDLGDLTILQAASTNTAGDYTLPELKGKIVNATVLGTNGVLIYSESEVMLLYPVGGNLVFGRKLVLSGYGCVSKNAVVSVGNTHYVFGPKFIYITDGNSAKQIDNPAVHRYVYEDFNYNLKSKVVGYFNTALNCVVFSYPTKGSYYNNKTLLYNVETGVWSPNHIGINCALNGVFENSSLIGDLFGSVWKTAQFDEVGNKALYGTPLDLTHANAKLLTGYGMFGYGNIGYAGVLTNG